MHSSIFFVYFIIPKSDHNVTAFLKLVVHQFIPFSILLDVFSPISFF